VCAAILLSALTLAVSPIHALSADLPKSTQEMLQKLKVGSGVLMDLDAALNLPKSILDSAKKAGPIRIGDTNRPKQFRNMVRPFHERYPWAEISYARSNRYDRVIKPLMAFKSGKVITDLIVNLGGNAFQFRKLNALVNIDDLPAYKQLPEVMKSPRGDYAGHGLVTACFAYNTKKVKKAELPKIWEDVVSSKRWAGGNLALLNRPDYWALHLRAAKGQEWTKDYLTRLFVGLKPQLRKEANSAAMQLLGAGEFDALIAGTVNRASGLVKKGSPVYIHCPDPVIPTLISSAGIIKGGNEAGAKLYLNWYLSREGQLAKFYSTHKEPLYPDLRKAGLDVLPDLKLDESKRVYTGEDQYRDEEKDLFKFWKVLWLKQTGEKTMKVTAKISDVKRGGRRYHFKVDGKEQKVRVSSSKTVVLINGNRAARDAVEKGMTCEISYPGNDLTAKEVSCKK
jgi:ABC-type Fe3+ transport system substrate-binding protein